MQIIRINWKRALPLLAVLCGAAESADDAGSGLRIDARVSQHGSQSGITNTAFTVWLPAGTGFAGLTGQISLAGSRAGFSEALVLVGTTTDPQDACARRNGTASAAVPAISRLWAGIVKNNGTGAVTQKVDVTLPHAVPAARGGACLMTLVSAGYPYLDKTTSRYTTTDVALEVDPVAMWGPASPVIPVGVGGEFRIPAGTGAVLATYVGFRANRALAVDAIAAAVSAAPVAGAPAGSGWAPMPAGNWAVGADFTYMPAGACAAGHFAAQPGNGILSVLRSAAPASLTVPAGAVTLMRMTLPSHGITAAQDSAFQVFPGARALAPGDCLIVYDSALSVAGVLDVENQSTVYLRPVP